MASGEGYQVSTFNGVQGRPPCHPDCHLDASHVNNKGTPRSFTWQPLSAASPPKQPAALLDPPTPAMLLEPPKPAMLLEPPTLCYALNHAKLEMHQTRKTD
eukprot:350715-Chlamydomonas_euryale.AAC.13